MSEKIRPLEIAFMGRDIRTTTLFLRQFAADNEEQVAHHRTGRVILKDGTIIEAVSPVMVRQRFDGRRYDQLILADDTRGLIRVEASQEIDHVLKYTMMYSCVPEEYQIQLYNVDDPPPRSLVNIEVSGLEELSRALAAVGVAVDELAAAMNEFAKAAKRDGGREAEIALIRQNPALSRWQKWRLVRETKRRTK